MRYKIEFDLPDSKTVLEHIGSEYASWEVLSCSGYARVVPVDAERKTGKWIEVDDAYNRIRGRCSVCGWEAHMYEDDVVGMDYCPNCGARLENGEMYDND